MHSRIKYLLLCLWVWAVLVNFLMRYYIPHIIDKLS